MKLSNFLFFVDAILLVIGYSLKWNTPIRIITIIVSVLLLAVTIFRSIKMIKSSVKN